jgi:hypothetical protein
MRGQSNQASLGQGASWAGVPGMGWDDEGLKRVAEEVSCVIGGNSFGDDESRADREGDVRGAL